MENFKKYETYIYLLLTLLISIVVHRNWVFIDAHFYHGDFGYFTRFNESWSSYFTLPYIWSTRAHGLGISDPSLSGYPFGLLNSLLAKFISSPTLLVKFIPLIPMALLLAVSSFFLFKKTIKNNYAAFTGSLVYSLNVYALANQASEVSWSYHVSLRFCPIYFIGICKLLERKIL